nr:hypothetical protein Iba_chr09cCG6700 [Ipomoea batatas]
MEQRLLFVSPAGPVTVAGKMKLRRPSSVVATPTPDACHRLTTLGSKGVASTAIGGESDGRKKNKRRRRMGKDGCAGEKDKRLLCN